MKKVRLVRLLMLPLFLAVQLLILGSPLNAIAACVPPPRGMVSWWPGDGNTSDIVGGNDGALVGGATFAAGLVDQSFGINGGYVEVPDAPSLDITGNLTIDAWINPSTLGGRVVDKITVGGTDGYLLDTYGGVVRLIVDGAGLSGSTSLPTGTWTHIAGVYDGSQMIVYVNGVPDGSIAHSGPIPANALPLRIGADSLAGSIFDGRIDEVEIFNRALSATEIQAIYNAGADGKCKTTSAAAPVPAFTGWGLVVFVVSAGLGSGYYLRRRKAQV